MRGSWLRTLGIQAGVAAGAVLALAFHGRAAVPTDNPVATYYRGDAGYPAWTDRIRWSQVVDMSRYGKGRTEFEKFESARDELAARGGGVLYYPAGSYDFSEGPFDGPDGRGLMLKPGVVIRGQPPEGRPRATSGRLDLPTRFLFGFTKRKNAVETGRRAAVWLDGGLFSERRDRRRPVRLQLAFPVEDGKIRAEGATAYAPLYGKQEHPVRVQLSRQGDELRLDVDVEVTPEEPKRRGKAEGPAETAKRGALGVTLKQNGDRLAGSFRGSFDGRDVAGPAHGALFSVNPETPRDWNLVGLCPPPGKRLKDVDRVGIAWVHLVGATIYFGPDHVWGDTWGTARSWKSDYVKGPWAGRVPDGTHPWDPLVGGGKEYLGAGRGRLVFGCVLEDAVAVNNSITMGRRDTPGGFGPEGYYMAKFAPRIGAYGSRVLVANNLLARSTGRNFKYRQLTRYAYPGGRGNSMAFGEESVRSVLFDYNKACGIDVNKVMLGLTGRRSPEDRPRNGFFEQGVVIRDNWVYNHGHKGFNVSGTWVTIRDNHNRRAFLREANDPYYIGGWELTLDGYVQSSPGGNGAISDNLSRAFDLAGMNLWAHANRFNDVGSDPGNDGEGLLCQAHGGTQLYSWALTRNEHQRGQGDSSYIGAWNVRIYGALVAWNKTSGWVGGVMFPQAPVDMAVVANLADGGAKAAEGVLTRDPGGSLRPPTDIRAAAVQQGDAVKITWQDASDNEIGFRVDRKIDHGAWTAIAYRPPRVQGSPYNPQTWIDFLAPPARTLSYRVAAINARDDDSGASRPTAAIVLPRPR